MKKVFFIIFYAASVLGCNKESDVQNFERVILGCWNISQNLYYCFEGKSTIWYNTNDNTSQIGSYSLYKNNGNITIKLSFPEFIDENTGGKRSEMTLIWTVKSFSDNLIVYEYCYEQQLPPPDFDKSQKICNLYELTRR